MKCGVQSQSGRGGEWSGVRTKAKGLAIFTQSAKTASANRL